MTRMRRVTIAIPSSLDAKILELRKEGRFTCCSYGEIARQLLESGLLAASRQQQDREEDKTDSASLPANLLLKGACYAGEDTKSVGHDSLGAT